MEATSSKACVIVHQRDGSDKEIWNTYYALRKEYWKRGWESLDTSSVATTFVSEYNETNETNYTSLRALIDGLYASFCSNSASSFSQPGHTHNPAVSSSAAFYPHEDPHQAKRRAQSHTDPHQAKQRSHQRAQSHKDPHQARSHTDPHQAKRRAQSHDLAPSSHTRDEWFHAYTEQGLRNNAAEIGLAVVRPVQGDGDCLFRAVG